VGVVDRWTSYRDFWFQSNSTAIQDSQRHKLNEVATYVKKNPSLHIAIDGSVDPRGMDAHDQNLCDQRVKALRDALVEAGVPAHKISAGAYGDVALKRDGRVEILIATAN
jgi:outer membrane protein OmpA-like peptidoglycan-associated protein